MGYAMVGNTYKNKRCGKFAVDVGGIFISSPVPRRLSSTLTVAAMDDSHRRIPSKNQNFEIILGSSSKARREILAEMGYEFTVMTADIDEKSIRKDRPEDLVMVLAEAKADAIMMKLKSRDQVDERGRPTLLITADTVVVYQGTIREKPSTEEEARQFIRDYSGGSGKVVGSVLVTNLATGIRKGAWESAELIRKVLGNFSVIEKSYKWHIRKASTANHVNELLEHQLVYFLDIPDEVIDSLIDEGIPFNVAGGLMLEHPLIFPLVDTVIGTVDCVMGLSKSLTETLIGEALV